MLDTARLIDTPESVHLQVSPVGPVPRALAFAIDLTIRAAVLMAAALVTSWFGEFGSGLWLLGFFLLEWLYPVWFEVMRHGATPGKRALRIRVVLDNGAPVGWTAALLRNLLRAVDFLPMAYGFGLAAMLIDRHFRRLGDIAAGTMVIYEAPAREPAAPPDAQPEPPAWPLTPEEQTALLAFAERAGTMNEERAEEIASTLAPIGAGSVEQLRRHAAWIHGNR